MPATSLARRRRSFTDTERAEYRENKRAEARAAIEQAARELLTSDGWRKWAETRATFREYSFNNCMLIAMQRPDATHVAGFKAWQQLGRQVRKGERSIKIMAPMVVKKRDDRGDDTDETITLFRAVPVFDIGQTDGEPLPEPPAPEPITGGSHAHYLRPLEQLAQSLGYRVEYRPLEHVGGFCDYKDKLICVSTTRTSANRRVRVLVHELAHALGASYKEYGRANAEVIVETAAVIVCGSIRLDTSGESIPYIAEWGEENKLDAIRKHAETVDIIARKIESAVQ